MTETTVGMPEVTCEHLRCEMQFAEFTAKPLTGDTVIAVWCDEWQEMVVPTELAVVVCLDCGDRRDVHATHGHRLGLKP